MSIHGWKAPAQRPDTESCATQFALRAGRNDWIEKVGGTRCSTGAAWVSNLSAEPVVFREVLDDLVRPPRSRGLLRVPDASSTAGSGDGGRPGQCNRV